MESTTRDVKYMDLEDGKEKLATVVLENGPRSIRTMGSKGAAGMLKMVR